MVSRLALFCVLSSLAMAGCASKPPSGSDAARTAYVPVAGQQSLLGRDKAGNPDGNPAFAAFRNAPGRKSFGSLAGRTLTVSSISEIRLADKEVILIETQGYNDKQLYHRVGRSKFEKTRALMRRRSRHCWHFSVALFHIASKRYQRKLFINYSEDLPC